MANGFGTGGFAGGRARALAEINPVGRFFAPIERGLERRQQRIESERLAGLEEQRIEIQRKNAQAQRDEAIAARQADQRKFAISERDRAIQNMQSVIAIGKQIEAETGVFPQSVMQSVETFRNIAGDFNVAAGGGRDDITASLNAAMAGTVSPELIQLGGNERLVERSPGGDFTEVVPALTDSGDATMDKVALIKASAASRGIALSDGQAIALALNKARIQLDEVEGGFSFVDEIAGTATPLPLVGTQPTAAPIAPAAPAAEPEQDGGMTAMEAVPGAGIIPGIVSGARNIMSLITNDPDVFFGEDTEERRSTLEQVRLGLQGIQRIGDGRRLAVDINAVVDTLPGLTLTSQARWISKLRAVNERLKEQRTSDLRLLQEPRLNRADRTLFKERLLAVDSLIDFLGVDEADQQTGEGSTDLSQEFVPNF